MLSNAGLCNNNVLPLFQEFSCKGTPLIRHNPNLSRILSKPNHKSRIPVWTSAVQNNVNSIVKSSCRLAKAYSSYNLILPP